MYLNDPVLKMQTKNEKPFEGTSDKAKQIEQLSSLFGYMPELIGEHGHTPLSL